MPSALYSSWREKHENINTHTFHARHWPNFSTVLSLSSCWKQSNSARGIDAQITLRCSAKWFHSSHKQIISYKWTVMLFLLQRATLPHVPTQAEEFLSSLDSGQGNKTTGHWSVFFPPSIKCFHDHDWRNFPWVWPRSLWFNDMKSTLNISVLFFCHFRGTSDYVHVQGYPGEVSWEKKTH